MICVHEFGYILLCSQCSVILESPSRLNYSLQIKRKTPTTEHKVDRPRKWCTCSLRRVAFRRWHWRYSKLINTVSMRSWTLLNPYAPSIHGQNHHHQHRIRLFGSWPTRRSLFGCSDSLSPWRRRRRRRYWCWQLCLAESRNSVQCQEPSILAAFFLQSFVCSSVRLLQCVSVCVFAKNKSHLERTVRCCAVAINKNLCSSSAFVRTVFI